MSDEDRTEEGAGKEGRRGRGGAHLQTKTSSVGEEQAFFLSCVSRNDGPPRPLFLLSANPYENDGLGLFLAA